MHTTWVKVIGAVLAFAAVPTYAQDAGTIADVRCLLIGIKMMQSSDASLQKAGNMEFLYYVGRIDGRNPGLDFEGLLMKELDHMTSTEFSSEAVRCGGALTEKGHQLQRIGKDLTDRGH